MVADRVIDPRLARQGYTAEQVDRYLRTSGLAHGARFDLLDISPNTAGEWGTAQAKGEFPKVGELATVPRKDGAAMVKADAEQKISGSLKLEMEPDERLRDTELEWAIRPQYLLRIPNGDILEFEQGIYVWGGADRNLLAPNEHWSLQLGDMTWFLDMAGLWWGGFGIGAGLRYTDGLKVLFEAAKIFDWSGIHDSEVTTPAEALWGMDRWPEWNAWSGFWYWANWDKPQVQVRTTTMLDVYADICLALSYYPPWTNRHGTPMAQPVRDIRNVQPVTTFGTASDSITHRDVTVSSDLSKISNFVWCTTDNPSGNDTYIGVADADQYYPDHPWAQNKRGRYLVRSVTSPWATTTESAHAQAFAALAAGLTYAQTITYTTAAHPTLDPYDVNLLHLDGDAELDTPTPYIKVAYDFDLFAGIQSHKDRRIVLPRDDLGVIDVGLSETWNVSTPLPT